MQYVAYLLAIAVNRDGFAEHGCDGEPGHPTLILNPELARAINATLTQRNGTQAKDSAVVDGVLICNAL